MSGRLTITAPSEMEEEKTLFRISTVGSPRYAFKKRYGHFFEKEDRLLMNDGYSYHSTTTINKKPKPGKDNPCRAQKKWFKVSNTAVFPEFQERVQSIIIAMGEILRFNIGTTHPKYRVVAEAKSDETRPISQGIEGYRDFSDVGWANSKKRTYQFRETDFYEGMGRVVFYKYFFYENDFNFGNMALNKDRQFVGFDHDCILSPLVATMRKDYSLPKGVQYDISDYTHIPYNYKASSRYNDFTIHIIPSWRQNNVGKTHHEDYESLPLVRQFLPLNWDFNDTRAYSKWLSNHPRFIAEKHYSAVQIFITQNIHSGLFDSHIKMKDDRNEIERLVLERFESFLNAESFRKYLANQNLNVVQVVLYEALQGLQNNKHYQNPEKQPLMEQWKGLSDKIIKQFAILRTKCELAPLMATELSQLTTFADSIYQQSIPALKEVGKFYKEQLMESRATGIEKQVIALSSTAAETKSEGAATDTSSSLLSGEKKDERALSLSTTLMWKQPVSSEASGLNRYRP